MSIWESAAGTNLFYMLSAFLEEKTESKQYKVVSWNSELAITEVLEDEWKKGGKFVNSIPVSGDKIILIFKK